MTRDELDKLAKDLERVHPGGTYTIDAQQLKQLLGMAAAKVDPWRMLRPQPLTWQDWAQRVDEALAHHHERLTALEESAPQTASIFVGDCMGCERPGCPNCAPPAESVSIPVQYLKMLQELHNACRAGPWWRTDGGRIGKALDALNVYHNGPSATTPKEQG